MNSKYNSYGRPVDRILDDIQIGDIVEYSYRKLIKQPGQYPKNILITVQGIWDGKKVQFNDQPEETIIRTKEWLKHIKKSK